MRQKTTVIAVGGGILIAVIVGWAFFVSSPRGQFSIPTINNVPYDVRVETIPKALTTRTAAAIRLDVSQHGQPVDIGETGRLLHVMIVSANLRDTYHTFSPTPEGTGVYSVKHVFTQPGQYRIWTELDDATALKRHDQNAEQVAYTEVTVRGTPTNVSSLVESNEATVGSYQIRRVTSRVEAGKPITLRVAVNDATGKPVPLYDHEPFLYFISGENFSFFRHGHGATLADGSAGLENVFPHAGKYVWWLNLRLMRGSTVEELPVPFLVSVSK